MLSGYLIVVALAAAPDVDLEAALTTQTSAGITPVQPGTPSGQAIAVEVNPNLAVQIADTRYTLAISYTPRIFYRGFLGDTDITPLNRPLFMHTAGIAYTHTLSESWSLSLTFNGEAGEVDFQSASAADPGSTTTAAPTAGRQTAAAQALTALNLTGALSLSGRVARSVTWGNNVGIRYTTPLGDLQTAETGEMTEVTVVGQLPESLNIDYNTSLSYAFNRKHSVNLGGTFSANFFEALAAASTDGGDGGGQLTEGNRTQTFQSVGLTLGYGYNFARNSSLTLSAGAQLAFGQADFTPGDDGTEGAETRTDLIPLPTASLGFTWLPVNQRSITVSNNLTVGIAGSVDPVFGTFQSRLSSALSFQVAFPPRLSIGVQGSLSTPLAPPEEDQGVTFAAGFGAGDSQLDLSVPVTYQFSRTISGGIGFRLSHFFTRFGVRSTQVAPDMGEEDTFDPLDSSTTYEVFVSLSFALSTRR